MIVILRFIRIPNTRVQFTITNIMYFIHTTRLLHHMATLPHPNKPLFVFDNGLTFFGTPAIEDLEDREDRDSNYGGGHKSSASMSALTLLAFLFFLHILQQCIRDHMMEMSSTQPVVVMTAGREGDETISKADFHKIDKTGFTESKFKLNAENGEKNTNMQIKNIADLKNPYDYDDSLNKKQLLKVHTTSYAPDSQTYKYVYSSNGNHSSHFPGFVSAMDEE